MYLRSPTQAVATRKQKENASLRLNTEMPPRITGIELFFQELQVFVAAYQKIIYNLDGNIFFQKFFLSTMMILTDNLRRDRPVCSCDAATTYAPG